MEDGIGFKKGKQKRGKKQRGKEPILGAFGIWPFTEHFLLMLLLTRDEVLIRTRKGRRSKMIGRARGGDVGPSEY